MSPQWIPQNLQKRLLLYILQQLLLFSEIDLPNLEEVSLNNICLRDVSIDPEKIGRLPGCNLRSGKLRTIELSGGVSGVTCVVSGVELVVAPSVDNLEENLGSMQFLLAQSTASLASTVMLDRDNEAVASDSESESESPTPTRSLSTGSRRPSTLGGMMSRAAEIALLRLVLKVSDILVKYVSDAADIIVHVASLHFSANNGMRYVDITGIKVSALKPHVNGGNMATDVPEPSPGSDSDSDSDYNESLMESTMFSPEESESIYMSATSQVLDLLDHEAVIAYIDKVSMSFEGLSRVSDLKIDIDSIKVAAVPLVPAVSLVLNGISKMLRMKNHQLRKHNAAFRRKSNSKFPEYEQEDFVEMDDDESAPAFSKLHIAAIVISLTSALTGTGEFASTHDDLSIDLRNINIKQKDPTLIYGGVETFALKRYVNATETQAFSFDTKTETPPNSKADIRFELFRKTAPEMSEITMLLSKPASCVLDCTSLQYLVNFSTSLSAVYDSLNGMLGDLKLMHELSGLKTASANIEPETRSQFLLQTASFSFQVQLSPTITIKAMVYPISYNKNQDQMTLQRIIVLAIIDESEEQILTIPNIVLRTSPQEFKHFACRPSISVQRECSVMCNNTLSSGTIKGSVSYQTLTSIKKALAQFTTDFGAYSQKVNALDSALVQPPAKLSHSAMTGSYAGSIYSNQTRFRRMKGHSGVTFGDHATSVLASFRAVIKEVRFTVTDLFGHFGNLEMKVGHAEMSKQSGNLYGFVHSVNMLRRCEDILEVVLSELDGEATLPMVLFALKSNDKVSSTDVVLQRFKVEYHAYWLDLLKGDATKDHNTEENAHISPASPSASSKRTDVHVTFNDFILGLNPMRLQSKLCLAVSKGSMDFTFGREQFYTKSSFRELSLFLVDDIKSIRNDTTHKLPNAQSYLVTLGFVMIGKINTSHIGITVNTDIDEIKRRNMRLDIRGDLSLVDVKMNSDELQVELCADSAHTLAQTVNDLKPPTIFKNEDKFKVNVDDDFHWTEDILAQIIALQKGEPVMEVASQEPRIRDAKVKDADTSDFCIVDEYYNEVTLPESNLDLVVSRLSLDSSPSINTDASTILVVEDHFSEKARKSLISIFPFSFNMNLSKTKIYLFDGFDWKHTRKVLRKAVKKLEARATQISEKKKKSVDQNSTVHEDDSKAAGENQVDPEFDEVNVSNDMKTNTFDEEDEYEPSETISDTLFQSIHFALEDGDSPSDLVAHINSQVQYDLKQALQSEKESDIKVNVEKHYKDLKLNRSVIHKVLVDLKNIEVNVINYTSRDPRVDDPVDSETEKVNNIEVRLDTITVYDNVPTSTWNKALTYMNILGEREVGTSMLRFSLLNVRPDSNLAYTEAIMRVSILPVRLYIDQDTFEFLARFFEFKDTRFLLPVDEMVYIQKLTVDPLKLKFDYKPKKVDYSGLRSGNNAELVNFFILDGSDISLREATVYGVPGFPKLGPALGNVYASYIQKYQLAGLLAGLSPVRSIVNIGGGVKDLVTIPLKEYKKSGRLMRSLQKGTTSFAKTTTYELLKLGVKLASGTQVILENLEEYFGGEGLTARRPQRESSSKRVESKQKKFKKNGLLESSLLLKNAVQVDRDPYTSQKLYSASLDEVHEEDLDFDDLQPSILIFDESSKSATPEMAESESFTESGEGEYVDKMVSLYSNQPSNVKEGLRSAYKSLERNLKSTKKKIVRLKNDLQDAENFQELITTIAKSSPVIVIRPMIGTTEAVMKALMGISNGIDSRYILESQDKYRNERSNQGDT